MRLGTRGSGTDLQDTLGGANGSSVPAPINTTSIADSGPPMPLSAQYARSTVAASPVHVRSASVSADGKSTPVRAGDKAALTGSLSGSKPASSKAVHKKQGRFDVWEGDADDMPSQPSLGDAALSKASMASDADGMVGDCGDVVLLVQPCVHVSACTPLCLLPPNEWLLVAQMTKEYILPMMRAYLCHFDSSKH